jgi:hypothetical protein
VWAMTRVLMQGPQRHMQACHSVMKPAI